MKDPIKLLKFLGIMLLGAWFFTGTIALFMPEINIWAKVNAAMMLIIGTMLTRSFYDQTHFD